MSMKKIMKHGKRLLAAGVGVVASASVALADGGGLTMPTLPTTDLETAGTAILGLLAVCVVIGMVIRTFKKA